MTSFHVLFLCGLLLASLTPVSPAADGGRSASVPGIRGLIVARDSNPRADTAPVPLTVRALHQMTVFWQRFRNEPAALRHTHREDLGLAVSSAPYGQVGDTFEVVDLAALATAVPAVAADLRAVGLSAARWAELRRALYTAVLTAHAEALQKEFLGAAVQPSAPVLPARLRQNVAFVQAHPRELTALRAAGMWFPPFRLLLADDPHALVGYPMPRLAVRQWVNGGESNGAAGGARLPFGDGHVYLVEFTAHWCGPCRSTYPKLSALQAQYAGRGVRLVYVTHLFGWYGGRDRQLPPVAELDSLRTYATEHLHALLAVVGPEVDTPGYPSIWVVDGRGVVRSTLEYTTIGGNPKAEMREAAAKVDTALTSPHPDTTAGSH